MAEPTLDVIDDTSAVSPDCVEIRGRGAVHAVVALAAGAAAAAYAWRIGDGASVSWWALVAVLAVVAAVNLIAWLQSRVPLLVADEHGVRVRRGRQWAGLTWERIESVDVERPGAVGDSVVVLVPAGGEEPVRVPFGAASRASTSDLLGALAQLRAEHERLLVAATVVREAPATRPDEPVEPVEAPAAEPPARRVHALRAVQSARRAVRAQVHRDAPATVGSSALQHAPAVLPEIAELRRTEGKVGLIIETVPAHAEPVIAVGAAPVEAYPTQPAPEPLIGPELTAARTRLRVSIDDLAERTRIRPHVIESIEVDDFAPCGGDFYARGHLRSLCRTLGVDPEPLLATYDREYAQAPVAARRVFEAELATGPQAAIRSVSGGPRWSLLIGVVMVLAIVWGAAKIVTERTADPAPLGQAAPSLPVVPSAPTGLEAFGAPQVNDLRLVATQRARVEVRGTDGSLVWSGIIRPGGSRELQLTGPAVVQSSVGKAVRVVFNGKRRGSVGDGARAAERTFMRPRTGS